MQASILLSTLQTVMEVRRYYEKLITVRMLLKEAQMYCTLQGPLSRGMLHGAAINGQPKMIP